MTASPTIDDDTRTHAHLEVLCSQYNSFLTEQNYADALDTAKKICSVSRALQYVYAQAFCLLQLRRAEEAYALAKSLPAVKNSLTYFDLMADICGTLGKWDEMRVHGAAALALRDSEVAAEPRYPLPHPSAPQSPGGKSIIAFSLFGAHPRYCEVAVMNCAAAARLLPGWRCRFYCDDSVPIDVCYRISRAGGEIQEMDETTRGQIPPLMWRFLVVDDPAVSRFLVRDADSLIGNREAAAVNAWTASGKWFHLIRDYQSHTEIMLAGLWGGHTGVIPSVRSEIQTFLDQRKFDQSHVDQQFLRKRIWPTARQSVLSHDSQFQFFNNEPFPDEPVGTVCKAFHVGANLSTSAIVGEIDVPDGTSATMQIVEQENRVICTYPVQMRQGAYKVFIPSSYAERIKQNDWRVILR